MTREEIKKKWKQGQFINREQKNKSSLVDAIKSQRTNSSWQNVQNRMNNQIQSSGSDSYNKTKLQQARVNQGNSNVLLPQPVVTQTTQNKENLNKINKPSRLNDAAYITKKTGAGLLTGVTGQAQAALTDAASQLKKGEQKSVPEAIGELGKKMLLPSQSNIASGVKDTIKENIDVLRDKDKNAWQKVAGVAMNSSSGALNALPFKQKTNALIQTIGSLLKDKQTSNTLLKVNERISKPSDTLNEQLAQEGQTKGKLTQYVGDAMQSVGNMIPSIATSVITKDPTASLLTMGIGVKGTSTNEALKKGVELEDAVKRGDTDAMVEVGTEMLSGGVNIFGKGAIDDVVDANLNKIKNNVVKFLAKQGVDTAGEVTEELISDVLGTVLDKGTVDPNANYDLIKDGLGKTGITTVLSTLALKVLTGGLIGDVRQVQNENIIDDSNLTDAEKENLKQFAEERGLKREDVEKAIKMTQEVQNQPTTIQNEPVLNQEQQITQEKQKQTQNETSQKIEQKPQKTFEENVASVFDEVSEEKNQGLLQEKTIKEVGNKNVNSYQYDNPEVKPYFQYMAEKMLTDVDEVQGSMWKEKGKGTVYGKNADWISDFKKATNNAYSFEKIRQGLNNIIEDKGSENNAVSKKLELYIDQNLANGFTDANNNYVEPNADYIASIKEGFNGEKANNEKTKNNDLTDITQNEQNINDKNVEKQIDKYNQYKKNIIKENERTINNLISEKNNTIRSLEQKIKEKTEELNNKKDKTTKVANTLKMQIENLKTRQSEIENIYNERIDKFNNKVTKKKVEAQTQKKIKQEAREIVKAEIEPLIENSEQWKDKSMGFLLNRETAQRNIEDVIQDKEEAEIINKTIFNPIQEHQANAVRDTNEIFSNINDLNLNKKKKYTYIEDSKGNHVKTSSKDTTTYKVDEATLAQLFLEKKINDNDLFEYGVDVEKIKNTANTFKEILDGLYDGMNETVIKYGYAPIGKIENYFPHFTENKPDTFLGKVAGLFGIDTTNNELPTEIAGRTEEFKPGKVFNSNILQRKSNKTDYDALKILERYVKGAEDIIHTTDDIQRLRQLERSLRYKFSEKGIQDRIDSIQNNNAFTLEEKEEAIQNILLSRENQLHHLSHFVTWLGDYTNVLANKKNSGDREFEKNFNRNMYSNMSAIESRIAANTIGGNLSVSLTNFAPFFQAMGTTKIGNLLTGAVQTMRNNILTVAGKNGSDFVDSSNFLTNRFGTDSIANQTLVQKVSNVLASPMEAVDAFTAETIVRAKYRENIENGMSEEQALKEADKYASRLMADRSKGALPIVFNNKNPVSKLFTMFQVEPNNLASNYLKDMPRNASSKTQLAWQSAKLMAGSWLFNTLAMAVRGGNEVLPDPIRMASYLIKMFFGETDEEKEQAEKDIQEAIFSSIPFAQNAAGFLGYEDIGRVPISNAMPDLTKLGVLSDKDVSSDYKKDVLVKEISKPLLYLGLPVRRSAT